MALERRRTRRSGRVLERARSERVDSAPRRPRGRPAGGAPAGRPHRPLRPAASCAGSAIGVVIAHDTRRARPALHRRRPAPRRDARRAGGDRRRPLERVSRDAVRRVVEAQELEREAARARAARRDGTGADVDPARAASRSSRRRAGESARCGGRAARARRLDAPGRAPARGRAAPVGARRLRARARDRAARRDASASRRHRRSTSRRSSATSGCPSRVETTLYRIVQEALTNVVKHAERPTRQHRADPQEAARWPRSSRTTARVRPRATTRDDGLGLLGMRERVALVGGHAADRVGARRRNDARGRGARSVIRVLVVDDHAVVRSGLRRVLDAEDDIETVGEARERRARRSSRRSSTSRTSC